MAAGSPNDEISLEDLVGGVEPKSPGDAAGVPAGNASPDAPAGAESRPTFDLADDAKVADVDNLLAVEDPVFASAMSDLQKQGGLTTNEPDIDPLDLEKLAREKAPGRLRLFLSSLVAPIDRSMGEGHTLRTRLASLPYLLFSLLRYFALGVKDAVFALGRFAKNIIKAFVGLPGRSKLVFALALVFGGLAVYTLNLTLGGRAHSFGVGTRFLKSLGDGADHQYTYDEHDPIDDFADPLFHPEHVIMLDKFVVNLRRPSDGTNPMGLFEFYFEASNQDCAVELKDREGEARDAIGRAIEQLTYGELVTAEGKEKLKVTLRKAVNSFLTRGQIRRVFIKTVVLKP